MPRWWSKRFARQAGHLRVGQQGERAAAKHLKKLGYTVLERNTELPSGELDLICQDPDGVTVVVVEVKARLLKQGDDPDQFRPEVHITPAKRTKLRSLTQSVRRSRGWLDRPIRIDVIAVDLRASSRPEVRHYQNAV